MAIAPSDPNHRSTPGSRTDPSTGELGLGHLATEAQREMLRQARWSFNLYFVAIAASTLIGVVGGGLLLSGKTTEGVVTTAAGLGAGTYCSQLSKDSQEKLAILLERLEVLQLTRME